MRATKSRGIQCTVAFLIIAAIAFGQIPLTLASTDTPTQGALRLMFDKSTIPTMYANKYGNAAGIYPGIIRQACFHMAINCSLQPIPFNRLLANLSNNSGVAGALIISNERKKIFDFSAPYIETEVLVLSNKGHQVNFNSVSDLTGKRVGVIRGWSYGTEFDTARRNKLFKVEEVDSDQQNYQKLQFKRVDVILATDLCVKLMRPMTFSRGIEVSALPLTIAPIRIAIHKSANSVELLLRFDKTIKLMMKSGEFNAIIDNEILLARTQLGRPQITRF